MTCYDDDMNNNDDELRPTEQLEKLAKLPELRRLLVLMAHNTVDMIFDDVDSVSDAYLSYDIDGMIKTVEKCSDADVDLVDVLERMLDMQRYLNGVLE